MFVCPYFPPHIGGSENYVYKIASGLSKIYGWEMVIVTTNQNKKRIQKEQKNGIKIYRLPVLFTLSNTPINPFWYIQIKKIIQKEKPALINAHMPVPFMADVTALACNNVPFVLTYHSGSMIKKNFFADAPIFIYEYIFLKYTLKKAELIICCSDYIKDDFLKEYKNKAITINPGVDALYKYAGKISDRKIILFVATLTKSQRYKGLTYLLQALVTVKRLLEDVRLFVVGDGNALPDYRKLVAQLGLNNDVVFTGSLRGRKLIKMFKKARVLVLPSLNESFGMVLIEAMAQSIPVIGTNIGGIPYIITHGKDGFLVPPKNAKALARAIKRILTDSNLAKSMGEEGYRKVKANYLWDKQILRTKELFDKFLT